MLRIVVGLAAALLLAVSLWTLAGQTRGLAVEEVRIGATPATTYARPGAEPGPAVVIAHGFAGSRQLMEPFATTLARAGYLAIAYDLRGHGRNPEPLTGDVAAVEGATATLLAEMAEVAAFARAHPAADGRLAILGHSMASDLVVRYARAESEVAATIAVSLFSPEVTAEEPRNLLVVTGALEAGLTDEALRVAGLAMEGPAAPFVTYGDLQDGTARRAVLSPRVEHVGVLYSPVSLDESRAWLDAAFGIDRPGPPPEPDNRGPWILALAASLLALGWAAAPLLPRAAPSPLAAPAGMTKGRFALAALLPAIAAPLLAWLAPPLPLSAPVADYLALHFLLYGLATLLLLWRFGLLPPRPRALPTLAAAAALAAFAIAGLYLPLDAHVASFLPAPHRLGLLAILALGLAPYFLADEALARHPGAPRLAYPITKLAFLASLALALVLDLERLFFLIIILPVILLFFLVFGLLGGWTSRATGSPLPAALALTLLFAWAIAVTFPLLG